MANETQPWLNDPVVAAPAAAAAPAQSSPAPAPAPAPASASTPWANDPEVTDPAILAQLNAPAPVYSPLASHTMGTLATGQQYQIPDAIENGLAGVGKSFMDTARGVRQALAHLGLSSEKPEDVDAEIAEARERDKALMNTTAGKVGNMVGQGAQMVGAGALLLPEAGLIGGASLLGNAALGAGFAALQPTVGNESRLTNAEGGALGGAGGAIAGKVLGGALSAGAKILLPEEGAATVSPRLLASLQRAATNTDPMASKQAGQAQGILTAIQNGKVPADLANWLDSVPRASDAPDQGLAEAALRRQLAVIRLQSPRDSLGAPLRDANGGFAIRDPSAPPTIPLSVGQRTGTISSIEASTDPGQLAIDQPVAINRLIMRTAGIDPALSTAPTDSVLNDAGKRIGDGMDRLLGIGKYQNTDVGHPSISLDPGDSNFARLLGDDLTAPPGAPNPFLNQPGSVSAVMRGRPALQAAIDPIIGDLRTAASNSTTGTVPSVVWQQARQDLASLFGDPEAGRVAHQASDALDEAFIGTVSRDAKTHITSVQRGIASQNEQRLYQESMQGRQDAATRQAALTDPSIAAPPPFVPPSSRIVTSDEMLDPKTGDAAQWRQLATQYKNLQIIKGARRDTGSIAPELAGQGVPQIIRPADLSAELDKIKYRNSSIANEGHNPLVDISNDLNMVAPNVIGKVGGKAPSLMQLGLGAIAAPEVFTHPKIAIPAMAFAGAKYLYNRAQGSLLRNQGKFGNLMTRGGITAPRPVVRGAASLGAQFGMGATSEDDQ